MSSSSQVLTQTIQDAVLKLCTQQLSFCKSLEIDGIICISQGEDIAKDIIVKMHRTVFKSAESQPLGYEIDGGSHYEPSQTFSLLEDGVICEEPPRDITPLSSFNTSPQKLQGKKTRKRSLDDETASSSKQHKKLDSVVIKIETEDSITLDSADVGDDEDNYDDSSNWANEEDTTEYKDAPKDKTVSTKDPDDGNGNNSMYSQLAEENQLLSAEKKNRDITSTIDSHQAIIECKYDDKSDYGNNLMPHEQIKSELTGNGYNLLVTGQEEATIWEPRTIPHSGSFEQMYCPSKFSTMASKAKLAPMASSSVPFEPNQGGMNWHKSSEPSNLDRKFHCDICLKSFKRKQHLEYHRRCHTGEKRFQCNLCMRKFSRLDNMLTHERKHNRKM